MSRGLIRPEAQPANWNSLNDSQKKAVTQILETIADTVEQLPKQNINDQQAPYLSSSRASRIAFLDGQRGTGKSTVLVTLLDTLKTGEIAGFPDKTTMDAMEVIKKRIVLLEPIDMEPVPQCWNMLPAILARIEDAFSRYSSTERNNGTSSGLLDPSNHYHDALRELQQLQNNISVSWDGNLNNRASRLDPDAYAQETMRNERARIQLNPNFEKTLNALAKQISQCSQVDNPLFLLPIDDFDLNPRVCLEMLRILRMISVPRLFTLILGDLEVVDVALNLKQSADLNAVYTHNNQAMLSVIPSEVAMLAGRVSAHALHKLLPPMQCIELRPLAQYESLNYCPLGSKDASILYEQLKKCPVIFGNHLKLKNPDEKHLNTHIKNLFDLFLTQGYSLDSLLPKISAPSKKGRNKKLFSKSDIKGSIYSGLSMLNTTPRSTTDLWIAFKKFSEIVSGEEDYVKGVNLIAQLCRNQLLRDSALTPTARRLTRGGFFNHPLGEWDLEALPIVIRSVIDNGRKIKIEHKNLKDVKCELLACRAIEWRFRLKQEDEYTYKNRPTYIGESSINEQYQIEYIQPGKHYVSVNHLSVDTTGVLILFHDLLSLRPSCRFNSFLLASDLIAFNDSWCKTIWSRGLTSNIGLPWYAPLCRSFLGFDLFLSIWNRMLDESNLSITPKQLVFAWISAGTAAITSRAPISIHKKHSKSKKNRANTDDEDWKSLGEELVCIIPDEYTHPILEKQIQTWLISVAILIMPETGLPDISDMYKHSNELPEYWDTYRRSIREQRRHRLLLIHDSGMKTLACKLYEDPIPGLNEKMIKAFQPHEFHDKCNRRKCERRVEDQNVITDRRQSNDKKDRRVANEVD